jgi:hypothetical protein
MGVDGPRNIASLGEPRKANINNDFAPLVRNFLSGVPCTLLSFTSAEESLCLLTASKVEMASASSL